MALFNFTQKNVHKIRANLIYAYLVIKKDTRLSKYKKDLLKQYLINIECNLPTCPAWWEQIKLELERKIHKWKRYISK